MSAADSSILELYGQSTQAHSDVNWRAIAAEQQCPFLDRKCLKVRKSAPEQTIGTCAVSYGKRDPKPLVICPHRLLGRRQVFVDCLHLLRRHEPGHELHIVPEIAIPGGSVDYFLLSVRRGKVRDFVGIEFQTLDTTGTVWPERQRFLQAQNIPVHESDAQSTSGYGMNWKMTAKTILVQLHHKVETFEGLGRHLALVIQDHFMAYMQAQFQFDHVGDARPDDPLQLHSYELATTANKRYVLELDSRFSTDTEGVAMALGLQADPNLELTELIAQLEARINDDTLFVIGD